MHIAVAATATGSRAYKRVSLILPTWCISTFIVICSSVYGPKSWKHVPSAICHIQFSEKEENILILLNRCRRKCIWGKCSQTRLCCLYVKLASVQIWGQTNKFPLTCSFRKRPKRWSGRSNLGLMKNSTIHFISKFLVQYVSRLFKL